MVLISSIWALIHFSKVLIGFNRVLIGFNKALIHFNRVLIGFERTKLSGNGPGAGCARDLAAAKGVPSTTPRTAGVPPHIRQASTWLHFGWL